MEHKIHHGLDQETAKKVADRAITTYCKKYTEYNPQFKWASETVGILSFTAKGNTLKGTVSIVGSDIVVNMNIPWLASLFVKPALKVIDAEVAKWVQAVNSGKLVL